jgi:CheY-like chemotaxis protein
VQVTDMTEDHNFREMAARMNQELMTTSVRLHEQTVAMAEADRAKDEFLAMLGHELRNPLGAISNAAQLVRMQIAGQDHLEKPVTIIIRQVRHTARLVEDLLDVSRISHGKLSLRKERVALCDILRKSEDVARPLMDLAGCTFSVSTPAQPIWIDGDAARLEQIIGNLLNNAAKYTEPGGTVSVTLRREADHGVITVRDTGVGIAPAALPRIFDLFVQEDRSRNLSRGGLGIGLTLAKSLAEMHGGTVGVESGGLKRGSTFTVRLPVSPERETARRAGDARRKEKTASLQILLVDDNVNAAQTLARILEMWGHTVRMAHDGPSAIDIARQDAPDVVLLDLGLPIMDGYEVARALRAMPGLERVRVLALTGYGADADRSRALEAGFDDYLVKPVDFRELQGTLSTDPD